MAIIRKKIKRKKVELEEYTNAIYNRKEHVIYLKKKSTGKYIQKNFLPSFFIETKNTSRFKKNLFDCRLKLKDEGKYTRIYYEPELDRDDLFSAYEAHEEIGIPIYEGDVDPVRRYLIDSGDPISTTFNSLFLDLETHALAAGFSPEAKKKHRIISFAAIDYQTGKKYYYACKNSSDKEESVLLDKLLSLIKRYDVVLAWNGDNYDFFVIKERMKFHKKRFDWRTIHFLDHMNVVKKIMDGTNDVEFKQSYSLDAIGETILGINKIDTGLEGNELHTLLLSNPNLLKEYNINDVVIMDELEKKMGFLNLWYSICSITKSFPNHRSIYPSYRTDGILLYYGSKEDIKFPTYYRDDAYKEERKKYKGGYVFPSKIGFHTNIQVPDFASLYPSIMISWNMSYETIIPENSTYDGPYCRATTSGFNFKTDQQGIIPKALIALIEERKKYKEKSKQFEVGSPEYKNADNLSTAVKVVANSIYGILGNKYNRYSNIDIAKSITLTGQYLTKYLINHFESKNMDVVAADTDSSFVKCSPDALKKELEYLNIIAYPKLLSSFGCPECRIKLDYDKGFETLLIVAKKNYAGKLSIHKGRDATENTPLEIKGLECIKTDKNKFLRTKQKEFLEILLDVECDPEIINSKLLDLGMIFMKNDIDIKDLIIYKTLRKPIDEYKGRTLSADIARRMEAEGYEVFVGMKIPHIITDAGPPVKGVHIKDFNGHFDRKYYWKNLILPPLERIIKPRFPDFQFDNVDEPRQLKFDFFGSDNDVQEKTKSIKKLEGKMIKKK